MKKFLSSIVMLITAMLLCCGCSEKKPEYYTESVSIQPITVKADVVSMKDIDASNIKKGVFSIKEAELTNSETLLVTYEFKNSASYARAFSDVLVLGDIKAYQEGVEIRGSKVGDIDETTNVMAGSTVEIKKQYALRNSTDPVTIHAAGTVLLLFPGDTYLHKELTLGTVFNENYIENTTYKCTISGAGKNADGQMVIDYSFTKTTDGAVFPATELAIQAYQGTERLEITNETKTDDTHYLKNYKVQPNQTVDLSTTFRLNNSTEDVTVYLTKPSTAEIYDKEIFSVK